MQTIVVVEKVERSMLALRKILQELGDQVFVTYLTKPIDAMECIENGEVDVLICNYEMDQMTCVELFDYFSMCSPHTQNIVMVEEDRPGPLIAEINQLKLHSIIFKPFVESEILTVTKRALATVKEERLQDRAYEIRDEEKKNYEFAFEKLKQEAELVDDTYSLFQNVMKGLINGTFGTAKLGTHEEMASFFLKISEVYNHFFYIETGNVWMYFNYYMNLFQKPQQDKNVEIHQKIQSELPHELLAKTFFSLFLMSHLLDAMFENYRIVAELAEDDSFVYIKFICDLNASRKADGTLNYSSANENMRKYMNHVVREIFDKFMHANVNVQSETPLVLKLIFKK